MSEWMHVCRYSPAEAGCSSDTVTPPSFMAMRDLSENCLEFLKSIFHLFSGCFYLFDLKATYQ